MDIWIKEKFILISLQMKKLLYTLIFLFAAAFLPVSRAGIYVSSLAPEDASSAASRHDKEVKKAILAARDQIKSGKDLDKAEQSMATLLNDSANLDNEKIWSTLFDALKEQYKAGNEALYLKQKYDTASLFQITSRLFTQMERYDSIDARPDKKGRVELKMRKENAEILHQIRPNLYNGGLYYLSRQKYGEAYVLLQQYIDAAHQPLFEAYHYEDDPRLPKAAYWSVYAAYKQSNVNDVLHNTYLALKDTAHTEMMLQYLSDTYRIDHDTARYVQTLQDGFHRYPLSAFFFSHLIEYYSAQQAWEKGLGLTEEALKADSTNVLFLLTKSTLLLNTGDYPQAYRISTALLERDDSLAEAVLNAGLAQFNIGVTEAKQYRTHASARKQALASYRKALPYLERFRQMEPDRQDKWALPLYTIYLNLNMGEKFDEVDKLMKASK